MKLQLSYTLLHSVKESHQPHPNKCKRSNLPLKEGKQSKCGHTTPVTTVTDVQRIDEVLAASVQQKFQSEFIPIDRHAYGHAYSIHISHHVTYNENLKK